MWKDWTHGNKLLAHDLQPRCPPEVSTIGASSIPEQNDNNNAMNLDEARQETDVAFSDNIKAEDNPGLRQCQKVNPTSSCGWWSSTAVAVAEVRVEVLPLLLGELRVILEVTRERNLGPFLITFLYLALGL